MIENADNPPLEITAVSGGPGIGLSSSGPRAGPTGSSTARRPPAPAYDTAAVLASLHRGYQPVRRNWARKIESRVSRGPRFADVLQ